VSEKTIDVPAIPVRAMSYEERNALEAQGKYIAELASYEKVQIEKLRVLKDVTPAQLRASRKQNAPKSPVEFPWFTMWLFMALAWGFLMMTFQKNVWPR
jgi:hypothetical protein